MAGKKKAKYENMFRELTMEEIEVRVQSNKGNGLSLLLYKDARTDARILNETVGPMNWQRRHEGNKCIVSIKNEETGEWINKEDVGKESKMEAEKGLYSDAFKRACFSWGIGPELYSAPQIFIPREKYKYNQGTTFYVSKMTLTERNFTELEIRDENDVLVFEWKKLTIEERNAIREKKRLEEEKQARVVALDMVGKKINGDEDLKKLIFEKNEIESFDDCSNELLAGIYKTMPAYKNLLKAILKINKSCDAEKVEKAIAGRKLSECTIEELRGLYKATKKQEEKKEEPKQEEPKKEEPKKEEISDNERHRAIFMILKHSEEDEDFLGGILHFMGRNALNDCTNDELKEIYLKVLKNEKNNKK